MLYPLSYGSERSSRLGAHLAQQASAAVSQLQTSSGLPTLVGRRQAATAAVHVDADRWALSFPDLLGSPGRLPSV